jgi:hypothetical protein
MEHAQAESLLHGKPQDEILRQEILTGCKYTLRLFVIRDTQIVLRHITRILPSSLPSAYSSAAWQW